jgi:hypothetical protein
MKRIALTLSVALSIAVSLAAGTAAAATLKGAVYSPEPSVICDKKGGFCADAEGLSVAMTKMYLGATAEKKLMDRIKKEPGVQDYDTATFTLTNGVSCDCKTKKCKVSKFDDKIDAVHTKALFGASAAASAAPVAPAKQGKPVTLEGPVYSPDPGAICDKKGGFCADYEGVSVALTKMYLGAKAEAHLMEQIKKCGKDFDATTFTLSDGIHCDCKARQCKDKLSGKPDAAHTQALFGH